MKKGIAVAGNIILDILKPLSSFPVRHELVKVLEKTFSLGGAVSNVARDLARLDPSLTVQAIGSIGQDGEGDLIIKELSAYKNIDLTYVKREGQTSFTDVLYEPETKARTFLVFGGAGDEFGVEDVPLDKLD
jgi:sugar/nucleoside kinase (ribokinase family)